MHCLTRKLRRLLRYCNIQTVCNDDIQGAGFVNALFADCILPIGPGFQVYQRLWLSSKLSECASLWSPTCFTRLDKARLLMMYGMHRRESKRWWDCDQVRMLQKIGSRTMIDIPRSSMKETSFSPLRHSVVATLLYELAVVRSRHSLRWKIIRTRCVEKELGRNHVLAAASRIWNHYLIWTHGASALE